MRLPWLPVKEWNAGEAVPETLAVSADFDQYMQERNNSMNDRVKWLSDNILQLDCIDLTDGEIHVEKLHRETPDDALQLSDRLYGIFSECLFCRKRHREGYLRYVLELLQ